MLREGKVASLGVVGSSRGSAVATLPSAMPPNREGRLEAALPPTIIGQT